MRIALMLLLALGPLAAEDAEPDAEKRSESELLPVEVEQEPLSEEQIREAEAWADELAAAVPDAATLAGYRDALDETELMIGKAVAWLEVEEPLEAGGVFVAARERFASIPPDASWALQPHYDRLDRALTLLARRLLESGAIPETGGDEEAGDDRSHAAAEPGGDTQVE